jgi:hypothetical protein
VAVPFDLDSDQEVRVVIWVGIRDRNGWRTVVVAGV